MAAKVRCPACKQVLTVPDSFAGQSAKCPKCGQLIRFKPPAPKQAAPPPVAVPPPVAATPPPPPAASRPARPSRPAAQRRPAYRPKRRSPWPWLAALGAVAALVAIALATGLLSGGGETAVTGSRASAHAQQPGAGLKDQSAPRAAAPTSRTTAPAETKASPQPAPGPAPKDHIQWTRDKPSVITISTGDQETLGDCVLLAWTETDKDAFLADVRKMPLLDGMRRAMCAFIDTAEKGKIDRVAGNFSSFAVVAVSEGGANPEATASTCLRDPQDQDRTITGVLVYYSSRTLLTRKPRELSVDLRRLELAAPVIESLARAKLLFAARVSLDGTAGSLWELRPLGR